MKINTTLKSLKINCIIILRLEYAKRQPWCSYIRQQTSTLMYMCPSKHHENVFNQTSITESPFRSLSNLL